jgi:transposase-like protein
MGKRARVNRTAGQKLEVVLEGLKSGNIAETCRRYEIAVNLYYRWKDEALEGASAELGGRSAPAALAGPRGFPMARQSTLAMAKSTPVGRCASCILDSSSSSRQPPSDPLASPA